MSGKRARQLRQLALINLLGGGLGGTSNATTTTHTLPFTSMTFTSMSDYSVGRGQDSGAECSPVFQVVSNSATLTAYKGPGHTAWTGSGTKFCEGEGRYRIA